jgi:hypothetical protein
MANPLRLALMTFPQHWDGAETLTLRVVLIPAVDPLPDPLIGSASPSFAEGAPTFTVIIDVGYAALPAPAGANVIHLTPKVLSAAASPATTFALLESAVTAKGATLGSTTPLVVPRIRKALPASYLAAGGGPPDGNFTTDDDAFGCAVRGSAPTPIVRPAMRTVGWGQIISYALRQPILAVRMGLVYEFAVTLSAADAKALAQGGYVFAALAATDPWAVAAAALPGSIRTHAARIPPLTSSARALFGAVEFPIAGEGGTPPDDSFEIADVYADGFAKLVHCSQPTNSAAAIGDGQLPPASDLGIELGWDDEQVVQWQNDQLALQAASAADDLGTASQTPLGVLGYRVDVADVTPKTAGGALLSPVWQSLSDITTTLPSSLGTYTGELCIEPVPSQPFSTSPNDAWLPRYFANWRGGSLCEPDPIPMALATRSSPQSSSRAAVHLTTLLSYGHTYSFRVRLCDLSGGGPLLADVPVSPSPAAVASQPFQRLVPPKAPMVRQLDGGGKAITPEANAPSAPASLVVSRPSIVYPEVLYTHLGDEAAWRDTIRSALVTRAKSTAAGSATIAGLPDPDVAAVSIEVLVRHPLHDTGTENGVFLPLYSARRTLDPTVGTAPLYTDPGTTIPIVYIDAPSIVDWAPTQPDTGPLLIPRGRDVQIRLRGLVRAGDPAYFGPMASQSMASTVLVRVEPTTEPQLLGQADTAEPISAYLFRRPADVAAPPLVAQLADELGIMANGDSLCTPPGMRIAFGASRALRTQISADGETLTFGSTSDLLRYWLVAIVVDLERDWTWQGLTPEGLTILRGGPTDTEATATAVGSLTIPRVVGSSATTQPSALSRSRTRLIFLDAIDPHEPVAGGFPQSLQHRWFVHPNRTAAGPTLPASPPEPVFATPPATLTGTDYADAPLDLRLPIAIPPTQVPAIASVGIALSPYSAGPLYASTSARERSLWIELTEPVDNPVGDALFARVLAHGADPILYDAVPEVIADSNPPLPLDPELVRQIIPGDTDDRAGLTAMTQLEPSPTSRVHFLLPLPPGVAADDPELFGFYTYELRIGHAGAPGDLRWWSTANGRFGSPLRVVGVQHPAPGLVCQAGRINIPDASAAAVLAAITAADSPFQVQQVLAPLTSSVTASSGTPSMVVATAPYATPVLDGDLLVTPLEPPKTAMWFLLYAQAVQADGTSVRNILIASEPGAFVTRTLDLMNPVLEPYFATIIRNSLNARVRTAVAAFHQAQVEAILASIHLPTTAALSVIAVEFLPAGTGAAAIGAAGAPVAAQAAATATAVVAEVVTFPFGRILRVSPLAPIAPFC